jgi:hypothetical protein
MNGWPRLTPRDGASLCDGLLPAIPPNPARAAPAGRHSVKRRESARVERRRGHSSERKKSYVKGRDEGWPKTPCREPLKNGAISSNFGLAGGMAKILVFGHAHSVGEAENPTGKGGSISAVGLGVQFCPFRGRTPRITSITFGCGLASPRARADGQAGHCGRGGWSGWPGAGVRTRGGRRAQRPAPGRTRRHRHEGHPPTRQAES